MTIARAARRFVWLFLLTGSSLAGCSGKNKGSGNNDGGGTPPPTVGATAPLVSSTSPLDGVAGLAINGKLTATFNHAMDPATINTTNFTVTGPASAPVAGTVAYVADSMTASFTPASNLAVSTKYTATITTGVKDPAGTAPASNHVWTITTGASTDTTPPVASSTSPGPSAVGVPLNRRLTVIFGKAMDPTTINSTTLTVTGPGGAAVAGAVTYAGTTATFTPASALAANTSYTVTLSTGVKDLAGNALATALVWSFTTGSTTAAGPSPVALGTAGDFVILAETKVSTTGATAVVGDIGISPAAETFLTGFSETLAGTFATASIVTGKLYAPDMAVPTPSKMTTAVGDMGIAYTDAAGRVTPDFTELGAGDVSGKTLVPGLYKWGTGLLMSSDVTLSGGPDDVWIFQIAQDVTVANGVKVTLAGGALPKNIFWQVAGQVTLGTTSVFKGNILSKTQIVLETGAVLDGRALAQTAVTLDANAVTKPAP